MPDGTKSSDCGRPFAAMRTCTTCLTNPEISDAEYDGMMNRLRELESRHPEFLTPDSPTQRVGGKPREGFVKVRHSSPMLSLDNALNEAELGDFDRRVRELLGGATYRYVAELKLDGLSMAVHYQDGLLRQAITRGDGLEGEDVTENARTIRSLPLRIATEIPALEVRGEVILNRRAFERLNVERDEEGLRAIRQPAQRRGRFHTNAGTRHYRLSRAGVLRIFPVR